MGKISKKSVDKLKEIYKKDYNTDLTDDAAEEAAESLARLFYLLWQMDIKDRERHARLKQFPDGFPAEGHRNCIVCHTTIDETNGWYDAHGFKCFPCRDAVRSGIIPSFVCHYHDSYYRTWQLTSYFGWKAPTVRKMIREGKLVARTVPETHEHVFLKKENPNLIDPKRRTQARKSYDRHQKKLTDARIREARVKERKEHEQRLKKLRA